MRERTPPRQIESEQFAQKLLERLAAQNIPGESLPVIFAGDQRAGGEDRPADGDERPRPRLLPEHRKPLAPPAERSRAHPNRPARGARRAQVRVRSAGPPRSRTKARYTPLLRRRTRIRCSRRRRRVRRRRPADATREPPR